MTEETDTSETDAGEETATEAPATPAEKTPITPPLRAAAWLLTTAVLVAILLGALVAGGLELRSVQAYRDTAARRDAILAVAKDVTQVSYSLDYEKFPQQSAQIADESTGKYRQGLVDSTQGLGYLLTQGKVKSTCEITAAGIEAEDGNTATVLLSVTTHLTNTQIQVPQSRDYRVAIGLLRQGDRWLVQSNDVIA